jgi:hypothetical protein
MAFIYAGFCPLSIKTILTQRFTAISSAARLDASFLTLRRILTLHSHPVLASTEYNPAAGVVRRRTRTALGRSQFVEGINKAHRYIGKFVVSSACGPFSWYLGWMWCQASRGH